MAATSATGTGLGASGKRTTEELAILANAPTIIFAGLAEGLEVPSSPPTITNTVVFPYPLPGDADKYVVMLTTANAGTCYVTDRDESDGYFTGFSFATESDGTIMYLVASVGVKPNI